MVTSEPVSGPDFGQTSAQVSLRCTLVHARIPIGEVRNFWAQVQELARQFAQIPRSGDQVYGFVAGLYPTDAPTLPDAVFEPAG